MGRADRSAPFFALERLRSFFFKCSLGISLPADRFAAFLRTGLERLPALPPTADLPRRNVIRFLR